ncbi:perlucin-like protein isoform X2 [Mercenaria mercenaria]|uniref:perlucin-like protein isoform X2 n=1 Tax=Mercenaria mercenaria TaxID=6596 RepID=UPI00234F0137|nr:perlucin-like protein isoform X2 [Mercenaria mercenaria]
MKFPGVILILLQVHLSNGEDAHCSRYHYEEQTLAKIVRMEHRLEELEKHADCHCPDGWVTFQGSCYLFSQAEVNFLDAEVLCSQTGGHLVRVESEQENNFLKHYMKQLKNAHYWMGLSDMDQEGTFKWYGTNDVVSFTDWISGEPSNGGGTEHCVHFYHGHSYSWNDAQCNSLMKAVCEQKSK